MSRLSEVEKESTELDDSVIQDFVHLKNDVAAMRVSWIIFREIFLPPIEAFFK